MDCKIVEKATFTVMGMAKSFKYDTCREEIPAFWDEYFKNGNGAIVCGMYGINIDEDMGYDKFEYLIADNYLPYNEVPDGFVTRTIPKHTWAVFPCKGPMATTIQSVNTKIFSEWLPNCKDYEIAAGYNVEMYGNPSDYPNGGADENYYCEIWIPIKSKEKN